jgi:hypothetical protein
MYTWTCKTKIKNASFTYYLQSTDVFGRAVFWIMTRRNIVGMIRRFGISFRSLGYDAT